VCFLIFHGASIELRPPCRSTKFVICFAFFAWAGGVVPFIEFLAFGKRPLGRIYAVAATAAAGEWLREVEV